MERLPFSSHLGNAAYKRFREEIFDSSIDGFLGVSLCNSSGALVKVKVRDLRIVIVAAETLMVTNQFRLFQVFPESYKVSVRRDIFGNIRFSVREGAGDDDLKKFYYPSMLGLVEDVCKALK